MPTMAHFIFKRVISGRHLVATVLFLAVKAKLTRALLKQPLLKYILILLLLVFFIRVTLVFLEALFLRLVEKLFVGVFLWKAVVAWGFKRGLSVQLDCLSNFDVLG